MSDGGDGDEGLAKDLEASADKPLHGQPTTHELLRLGKLFAIARADRRAAR
jgi:hypothetical protein